MRTPDETEVDWIVRTCRYEPRENKDKLTGQQDEIVMRVMELQDEGRREKAEDLMKEGLTGYVKPPEKKEEEKVPELKKTNSDTLEKKEEPAADAIKEEK